MNTSKIYFLVAIILCCGIWTADAGKRKWRRSKRNHKGCRARSMIRYQMTVKTEWDQDTFPKMYPMYRPPAHFSQLIGRSHGEKYEMWREGSNASLAVETFAEREDAGIFASELSQGHNDVLDAFIAPEIESGVGQTSTVVFLDGLHSKVSFIMKIVPSPDWFIGLDATDLCYRGRWKRKIFRDLRPLDAGTDKGLTFTAPNYDNDPQDPISPITASYPDHPASSFFYPEYKTLPRLAYVEFQMISEYRLKKVYQEIQVQAPIPINRTEHIFNDGDNVKPKNEDIQHSITAPQRIQSRNDKANGTTKHTKETRMEKQLQTKLQKYKSRQDCQVSEWSQWSSCSKTCGYGDKMRSRTIIKAPKNGGQNCPLLNEESVCGNMRNCNWSHFKNFNKKARSPLFSSFRGKRAKHRSRRRK